jgi:hypothetical protein
MHPLTASYKQTHPSYTVVHTTKEIANETASPKSNLFLPQIATNTSARVLASHALYEAIRPLTGSITILLPQSSQGIVCTSNRKERRQS